MTDYLHHVPGRLRVRSKSLRCNTSSHGGALRQLRAQKGVHSVRHNAKAGCVTVCYDVRTANPDALLSLIERECLPSRASRPVKSQVTRRSAKGQGAGIAGEIGRMALGALVNRGVGYSISSLLGVRA